VQVVQAGEVVARGRGLGFGHGGYRVASSRFLEFEREIEIQREFMSFLDAQMTYSNDEVSTLSFSS
jgi:hypothetical protein